MVNPNKELESGVERYEGQPGTITETIDSNSGQGRVKIGGESWRAISDKISLSKKVHGSPSSEWKAVRPW